MLLSASKIQQGQRNPSRQAGQNKKAHRFSGGYA